MTGSAVSEVAFSWDDLTLAGTLHLPDGDGPHPVVLMLQGSGPADRDSGGFFPNIRPAFLKRGVAAFSFDKPGCGDSTGDWRHFGLRDRAAQASVALDALRGHPAVDAARVGIWGHSQGGWLAQMLAAQFPALAFAVSNSGPSINVREQSLFDCENTMRSSGYSEAVIADALSLLDSLHEAAGQRMDFSEVDSSLLSRAKDEPWYGRYFVIGGRDDWHHFSLLVAEGYEPRETLARVRCPFLAVFGGLDLLVPPWRGAQESAQALQQSGNGDSTIVVFPGGDHRIQDTDTKRFAAGYLDLLGDWVARRVAG